MNIKEEIKSTQEELGDQKHKFILYIPPTQTPSSVHDIKIEIKYEEMDLHTSSSTSKAGRDESENKPVSTTQHFESSWVKAENKDLDYFYLDLDLVKCEEDSETPQPTQDPLLIDPDTDLTHAHQSSVEIKCEIEDDIRKIEFSKEDSNPKSECDLEFESEVGSGYKRTSANDPDPDPDAESSPSPDLTPIVYRTHMPKIHSQFKCKECGEVATTNGRFTLHMRTHFGEKPFKCDVCPKGFVSSYVLTRHKRIHTGERPFKCEVCGKCFPRSGHLTSHLKCHSQERPYKCDVCDKGFKKSSDMLRHKRIHTEMNLKKPYECTVCRKRFTWSSDLTKHSRTHTGECGE